MADLPIIFSAPMVRALLDGRKTQTRRIIKKAAALDALAVFGPQFLLLPGNADLLGYSTGDRLYVREAFWLCEECGYRNWCAGGANYSGFPDRWCCASCDELLPRAKTSPIHMPRWASRITLLVTEVRVERLQDISEADAVAEGCKGFASRDGEDGMSPQEEYRDLWNSLHPSIIRRSPGTSKGNPAAWDANPWVAAYSFTVQRGNIDQIGGAA